MTFSQPLSAIADAAYLADVEAREQLVVAGLDVRNRVLALAAWPLDVERPCDEAALAIMSWPDAVRGIAAVAYTESLSLDLSSVAHATAASGRDLLQLVTAGSGRWRSTTCSKPRCCPRTGNRYVGSQPGHPRTDPLPGRTADPVGWRTELWDRWQAAIADGVPREGRWRAALAGSLLDIPLRDALLAQSARNGGAARPGIRSALHALQPGSTLGVALPLTTCLAAMLYLDSEIAASRALVNAVLMIDDYSLARLLRNGIDMRAPSSLLARSFAHFDPLDLLAA